MFHSFVGLAAVLTSVGHWLVEYPHLINDPQALAHKLAVFFGVFTGGVTFTGSLIAFAKLQGLMSSVPMMLPNHNKINLGLALTALASLGVFASTSNFGLAALAIIAATGISKTLGVTLTSAIGGADMPVVITVLNSYSGWALCAEGFMLNNSLLTIVGALVGSSGAILSYIMCKAMNRSLTNVIFGGFDLDPSSISKSKIEGTHTEINCDTAVEMLVNSKSVIIVPGYGLAVAKAQYPVGELVKLLMSNGCTVKYHNSYIYK